MLTQTTESAIKLLLHLALSGEKTPQAPRQLAGLFGASPTYFAKITNLLVKANILRAHRGALGGVTLHRDPAKITLLEIFEACQGQVVGDYCQETSQLQAACAYHQAMHEIHEATTGILSRWTLADLVRRPFPLPPLKGRADCRMLAQQGTKRS